MLTDESVILVSNDKAFYEGYSFSQGLSEELKCDLKEKPNKFEIYPNLTELLTRIRTNFWMTQAF